jgi:hypothetical protein
MFAYFAAHGKRKTFCCISKLRIQNTSATDPERCVSTIVQIRRAARASSSQQANICQEPLNTLASEVLGTAQPASCTWRSKMESNELHDGFARPWKRGFSHIRHQWSIFLVNYFHMEIAFAHVSITKYDSILLADFIPTKNEQDYVSETLNILIKNNAKNRG